MLVLYVVSLPVLCTSVDENECTAGNAPCSDICINTIGGFYCTCPGGYKIDETGKNCIGRLATILTFIKRIACKEVFIIII